jgi:hypothetical protein
MTTNQDPRKNTSGTATAGTNKDERGQQRQENGPQRAGTPGQNAGTDQSGKGQAGDSNRRDGMSDANDPPAGKRPGTTPDQAKPVAGDKTGTDARGDRDASKPGARDDEQSAG